jgi:ferredoxin--NADP+ reductase
MDAGADPILPTPRLNVAGTAQPVRARLAGSSLCAATSRPARYFHVEIDVGGTALEGAFLPGQSFGVIPPADAATGKAALRIYSVASPSMGEDGHGRVLAATIRVEEGATKAASYMASLSPGEELAITGPLGRNFLLPADPSKHDYVFVGSGTGVAPFRAMLLELAMRAPQARATLISAAPSPDELVYDEHFVERASRCGSLSYLRATGADDSRGGEALDEAITCSAPLLSGPRTLLYVCGPGALDRRVRASLERHGVSGAYFPAPADALAAARPTRRCMIVSY